MGRMLVGRNDPTIISLGVALICHCPEMHANLENTVEYEFII